MHPRVNTEGNISNGCDEATFTARERQNGYMTISKESGDQRYTARKFMNGSSTLKHFVLSQTKDHRREGILYVWSLVLQCERFLHPRCFYCVLLCDVSILVHVKATTELFIFMRCLVTIRCYSLIQLQESGSVSEPWRVETIQGSCQSSQERTCQLINHRSSMQRSEKYKKNSQELKTTWRHK